MNLKACTEHVQDPRNTKGQVYSLESLLLIIFSSIISGYDTPSGMSKFAELKLDWLNQWTKITKRPCAETFRALLVCIKPSELIQGFQSFVVDLKPKDDVISLDGKTMRGTKRGGNDAIHIISAWSMNHGITLGALASEGKKNEIKTLPKLIDKIEIKGAILTTDAMGCQKEIANKIIEKEGDYILQLKGNQDSLHEEIKAYHHKLVREKHPIGRFEEIDKGHGRLEIRTYSQFELSDWVSNAESWKGARTAIMVERQRETSKGITQETAWYLSSLPVDPERIAKAVRGHWEIENKLHWRLDVLFDEDKCLQTSAAVNVAVIKRFCMNLLKQNDKSKDAMVRRIMSCAISDDYREKILLSD